jgi:hypothetical protein
MMDDELDPREHDALAALPREAKPGDLLEERTVRALAEHGLLQRRRALRARPALAWAGVAAACVIFFVAGFGLGQNRKTPVTAQWNAKSSQGESRPATQREDKRRNPAEGTNVAQSETSGAEGMRYVVWF